MAGLLLRMLGRAMLKIRRKLERCHWVLYYCPTRGSIPAQTFRRFQPLVPPLDRFWADPFVVRRADQFYIFLEEAEYPKEKGYISVIRMDAKGAIEGPTKILEQDYHMSYPFVFEHEGRDYMIPETSERGAVGLYEAIDFPFKWKLSHSLVEGVSAVDPSIIEYDGRWWMFFNAPAREGLQADELHLYMARNPLGPWAPHPRNPLKSDVRSSRPAGRPFWREGKLFRPAQNCSIRYGGSIVIHEVRRLDEEGYEEVAVSEIRPWHDGITGTHTLNSAEGLTVVDACRDIPRYPLWKRSALSSL
jgi:hypothetical protein